MAKKKTATTLKPAEVSEIVESLDTQFTEAPTSQDVAQALMFFDPAMITVGDNTRLKLKQSRVDLLAEDIRERGKVLEPVGVEEMVGGGFELIYGKYRHAAVTKLNADGVDIQLPAIVYAGLDTVERLKMQVSENLKREDLSLVDKALAMKALLDKGQSKVQVRNFFSAAGGRKGNAIQPMSNVYVNDHLFILTLPKSLQDKIDDGIIPISTVKRLIHVKPELRESVVKQAEATRAAELEAEEKAEDKYVKSANKEMEAEEKAEAKVKELAGYKKEAADLVVIGKQLDKAIKDINLTHSLKFTAAEAAKWQSDMKEATQAKIMNDKAWKKASNNYAKLKEKLDAAKEPKEVPAPKVKTSIGPAALDKAIAEVTGTKAPDRLKMSELVSELGEMRKIGHDSPAFLKVLDAFSALIEGTSTTKEAAHDIAAVLEVVLSSKPVSRRKK